MYIHEHLQNRLRELKIDWEPGHPKFVYIVTQVLEFFDVYTEDDITDQQQKLKVIDAIIEHATAEDIFEVARDVTLAGESKLRQEVAKRIRPMYEFLAAKDLTEDEKTVQYTLLLSEDQWQSQRE